MLWGKSPKSVCQRRNVLTIRAARLKRRTAPHRTAAVSICSFLNAAQSLAKSGVGRMGEIDDEWIGSYEAAKFSLRSSISSDSLGYIDFTLR